MRYHSVEPAVFLERPNRFIARVICGGREETAHVKNTGRCRELLIPGARVYVQRHRNPARKTALSLIAVEKDGRLVNIDSQAPNAVWQEALAGGLLLPGRPEAAALIRREAVFGDSRLDFYIEWPEVRGWMEVKGVTLEEQGVVRFPDAPTERGRKHLRELSRAAREGCGVCHPDGRRFVLHAAQTDGSGIRRRAGGSGSLRCGGAGLRLHGGAGRLDHPKFGGGGAVIRQKKVRYG